VFEDGLVKGLFGLEVAEDDRLCDTGGSRNFLRSGAFEPLAREKIESGFEELVTTVGSVEACRTGIHWHKSSVSKYLLACQWQISEHLPEGMLE